MLNTRLWPNHQKRCFQLQASSIEQCLQDVVCSWKTTAVCTSMLRVLGSVFLGAETQRSQRLTAIKGCWKHAWQLCHEEVRTICSTRYAAVISQQWETSNAAPHPTQQTALKLNLPTPLTKAQGFFPDVLLSLSADHKIFRNLRTIRIS